MSSRLPRSICESVTIFHEEKRWLHARGTSLRGHIQELSFKRNGERNDLVASVRFDPLRDFTQPFVLLLEEIGFTHVDQVNGLLGRQEQVVVEHVDLIVTPVAMARVMTGFQPCKQLLSDFQILLLGLVLLGNNASKLGNLRRDELDILETQLVSNDFHVSDGVHAVLDVNNISIVKNANHLKDAIGGFDVGKKSIAKTSAFSSAAHKSRDVGDLEVSWHNGAGPKLGDQPIEALIGDNDATEIGVDGAEGEVLGGNLHAAENVEKRRFSNVGHSNNAA